MPTVVAGGCAHGLSGSLHRNRATGQVNEKDPRRPGLIGDYVSTGFELDLSKQFHRGGALCVLPEPVRSPGAGVLPGARSFPGGGALFLPPEPICSAWTM